MLTNLKLGGASPITLTNADTDLNTITSFQLPELYNGSSSSYISTYTPYAFGPVTGSTEAGATNYGYLYNFPAATAGKKADNTEDAPNSICPKGWKLPKGGVDTSDWETPLPTNDFANLDKAFGGTGKGAWSGESNIAKWQYTGPLKGVFSGYWYGGFDSQSESGGLWSSFAYPDSSNDAFAAYFEPDYVGPGLGNDHRNYGLGVRCLLK